MTPLKEGGEDPYWGGPDYSSEDEFWEQAHHYQPTTGPSKTKPHKDKNKPSHKKSKSSSSSSSSSKPKSKDKGKGKESSRTEKDLICEKCGDRFNQQHMLNKHMAKHTQPVKCQYPSCTEAKASNKDMIRHIWTAHQAWAEEINLGRIDGECPRCKEHFTRTDNLKQHLDGNKCKSTSG